MARQGGGNSKVMNFGKSRARMSDPSKNPITFKDVAGADVYKRQDSVDPPVHALRAACGAGSALAHFRLPAADGDPAGAATAVSYTHLDVYKRQGPG